ncbi:unnamed protein product, partial [Meganyctiphanes norvegica]
FSVVPSGPALDLKVIAPVVIGSIPLQQNFSMFATSPTTSFAPGYQSPGFEGGADQPPPYSAGMPPSAPADVGFTFPGLSQYPDMPPPSYAESNCPVPVQINWDNAEQDNSAFNLRYVSYNFKNK